MPFMEMTSQCEALTTGKQQKISTFMSFQPNTQPAPMPNHQTDQMELDFFNDSPSPQAGVQSTNPFLVDNWAAFSPHMDAGNSPSADDQFQQHFLKLPASSPYDHFMRAAGSTGQSC